MRRANRSDAARIAALIHWHMCFNDDVKMVDLDHLAERWGGGGRIVKLHYMGLSLCYETGRYDASSSVIKAWQIAFDALGMGNPIEDATWTGNIKEVFLASGLFEETPLDEEFLLGDVFLNEQSDCAMWQESGEVSCFVYGESSRDNRGAIRKLYDGGWDTILRYKG